MFEVAADISTTSLFQGDVIRSVPSFGAINLKNCTLHCSILGEETAIAASSPIDVTISKSVRRCDVVILSHSCEIALENGEKVTSIIVAPIRDVNTATKADKLQELIESNDVDMAEKRGFSYLKYYYMKCGACQFPAGAVVDFNKVFSFHKSVYGELLKNKVAQMTAVGREKFSLKLALYYYRKQNLFVV